MKTFFKWFVVMGLLGVSLATLAEPSSEEIYKVAKSGDMQKANQMIDEVLVAHPKNAKAHFIKAQLDAAQGRVNEARTELAVAESLSSDKPFASSQAIAHLKDELTQLSAGGSFNQNLKRVKAEEPSSNWMTWLVLIVVALIVIAIIRAMMRPKFQPINNGVQGYGAQGYGGGQPNGGPGYGPVGGGMGSGIMGGLATGAAIGAGVVAGEMLMHKVLDNDHPSSQVVNQNNEWEEPQVADSSYDMGGDNFGASDSGWDSGGGGGDDWS